MATANGAFAMRTDKKATIAKLSDLLRFQEWNPLRGTLLLRGLFKGMARTRDSEARAALWGCVWTSRIICMRPRIG